MMRRFGVRASLALALGTASAPILAHEPSTKTSQPTTLSASTQSAAAAVDAFHEALHRGDTRSAASLLAEDGLIFEAGGVERTKAEYVARHLPADAEFSQAVSSTMTRRTGGSDGNLAWIASEGRTTGEYKDKPVDQLTTETMLLRRVGRAWKIVHIHWSSGPKR